jgi:hypothetical protein
MGYGSDDKFSQKNKSNDFDFIPMSKETQAKLVNDFKKKLFSTIDGLDSSSEALVMDCIQDIYILIVATFDENIRGELFDAPNFSYIDVVFSNKIKGIIFVRETLSEKVDFLKSAKIKEIINSVIPKIENIAFLKEFIKFIADIELFFSKIYGENVDTLLKLKKETGKQLNCIFSISNDMESRSNAFVKIKQITSQITKDYKVKYPSENMDYIFLAEICSVDNINEFDKNVFPKKVNFLAPDDKEKEENIKNIEKSDDKVGEYNHKEIYNDNNDNSTKMNSDSKVQKNEEKEKEKEKEIREEYEKSGEKEETPEKRAIVENESQRMAISFNNYRQKILELNEFTKLKKRDDDLIAYFTKENKNFIVNVLTHFKEYKYLVRDIFKNFYLYMDKNRVEIDIITLKLLNSFEDIESEVNSTLLNYNVKTFQTYRKPSILDKDSENHMNKIISLMTGFIDGVTMQTIRSELTTLLRKKTIKESATILMHIYDSFADTIYGQVDINTVLSVINNVLFTFDGRNAENVKIVLLMAMGFSEKINIDERVTASFENSIMDIITNKMVIKSIEDGLTLESKVNLYNKFAEYEEFLRNLSKNISQEKISSLERFFYKSLALVGYDKVGAFAIDIAKFSYEISNKPIVANINKIFETLLYNDVNNQFIIDIADRRNNLYQMASSLFFSLRKNRSSFEGIIVEHGLDSQEAEKTIGYAFVNIFPVIIELAKKLNYVEFLPFFLKKIKILKFENENSEIAEGIGQFCFSGNSNDKAENFKFVISLLSIDYDISRDISSKITKEIMRRTFTDKNTELFSYQLEMLLNENNKRATDIALLLSVQSVYSYSIEEMIEFLKDLGERNDIKLLLIKNVLKEFILVKDDISIVTIVTDEVVPSFIRQELINLLSNPNKIGKKGKLPSVLSNIKTVLKSSIVTLLDENVISVPMSNIVNLFPSIRNDKNVIEAMTNNNKIDMIESLKTINKVNILSPSEINNFIERVDKRIEQINKQIEEVEGIFSVVVSKTGMLANTRAINNFKESDIEQLVEVFKKKPHLFNTNVVSTIANNASVDFISKFNIKSKAAQLSVSDKF